jgi:hypothetical protein
MEHLSTVKQRLVLYAAMAAVFCGMGVVENGAVKARPVAPESERVSSVYMLAGEFRTVFANLLWIKAEQYHHEYLLRDPNWASNKELMGLLDLITALDPHFVEAYEVGVYILADGYHDPNRALAYLRRAIASNPKDWELHNVAAVMFVRRFHDPEHALPHALLAYKYCGDEFYQRRGLRLIRTIKEMTKEEATGHPIRGR